MEALCHTGRCLWNNSPDAELSWDTDRPRTELGWAMAPDGTQTLALTCRQKSVTVLRAGEHAVWLDTEAKKFGMLEEAVGLDVLYALRDAPAISPKDALAVAQKLPPQIAGMALPRPKQVKVARRKAKEVRARLTLGAGRARMMQWGNYDTEEFPVLKMLFSYDGQEVDHLDRTNPTHLEGDQIVTLIRDHDWEAKCLTRLQRAGAIALEDVEFCHPSEALMAYDLVFAGGQFNPETTDMEDALVFMDQHLPQLRADGWDIDIAKSWPFQISDSPTALRIETRSQAGRDFQGSGWFDLGFALDVDGVTLDMAPLVASALRHLSIGLAEQEISLDAVRTALAEKPSYASVADKQYVAVDLTPLAPVLLMILQNQLELGALHASDAALAGQLEDALAGSDVTFSDSAGILPLARSLMALSEVSAIETPEGVLADLRDYQALGAAWMATLISAGFGGVLADDMGLGKTLQVLTLLQARKQALQKGPSLLIVPTSLLHTWQEQAQRFTPTLRLLILHGPDRHARANDIPQADLVITTYALLTRDRDRLCARDWPLIILDGHRP